MTVAIRSIGTATPETVLTQRHLRDLLASQPGLSRLGQRRVTAVFDASGIETRHTVVDELASTSPSGRPALFFEPGSSTISAPSTGARNQLYSRAAPALFSRAAARALEAAPGIEAQQITHLVTVSCTGFVAPGPDVTIVRDLGLQASTERFHLGFMGCYGAFPALRMARAFCEADPAAVVLVVAAELCSIHLHTSEDPDTIVSSSVFADGAAAALVTGRPPGPGDQVLDLDAAQTVLLPDGASDMTWSIGDLGFDMTLSGAVPRLIERHIEAAMITLLDTDPSDVAPAIRDIPCWAIHPGGRSILDRVQRALKLNDEQLEPSRDVLRSNGNMSSATVLFILKQLLEDAAVAGGSDRVCAMAFGPGLTAETMLFTRHTG